MGQYRRSIRFYCLFWGICLVLYCPAHAQFPRRCTDRNSILSRECCPSGVDGSKCGEESKQGTCVDIPFLLANLTMNESLSLLLDDRAWWPRAFYDRTCRCAGNFDGVDCSQCKHGYEGGDCERQSTLKLRRNITLMTDKEIKKFIAIMDESKRVNSENFVILTTAFDRILQGEFPVFANASIYDVFVWMHYYVTRDNLLFSETSLSKLQMNSMFIQQNRLQIAIDLLRDDPDLQLSPDVDYAHEGPAFLPWHRYFMLKWEREIGEYVANDPEFALPYWDWRDQADCDVCNDLMLGGQRSGNASLLSIESPFSQWLTICTKGNEYTFNGEQCSGEAEGFIQRNPGNYDPTIISGLPSSNEVNNMLKLDIDYDTPSYDGTANMSYRNILEGFANPDNGIADSERSFVHNAVHLYMNGTMSSVDTSANDPIFVVHHVFVDSLFEVWLRKQQSNERVFQDRNEPRLGHRMQDFMVPFFPLVQNRDGFTSTSNLGYVYDYMNEMESSFDVEEPLLNFLTNGRFDSFEGSTNASEQSFLTSGDYPLQLALGTLNETNWSFSDNASNADWHIKTSQQRGSRARRRHFKKRGKQHHWNKPRFYEGSHRRQMNEIKTENWLPSIDQTDENQSLTQESNAVAGAWESIQGGFSEVNRALRNMSRDEVGLLILACCLVIGCVLTCVCISRSRPRHKRIDCCCYCCRNYQGEEEEYYALLDTSKDHQLPNNGFK